MDPTELFRSVGDVWFLWAGSLAALGYLFYRAGRRISWRRFCRLLGPEEEGASYVLPYVLTFPIYMLLVCVMIQGTLILMVKLGTYYAAYAAARSAIVWRSIEPNGDLSSDWVTHDDGEWGLDYYDSSNSSGEALAQQKATRAATLAMAPFASSNARHLTDISQRRSSLARLLFWQDPLAAQDSTASRQYDAYQRAASDNISQDHDYQAYLRWKYQRRRAVDANALPPQGTSPVITTPDAMAPDSYVQMKFKFAALATNVQLTTTPNDWNADLTATVSYEMPMIIPGVGRILGGNSGLPFFSRVLTTAVTLPSETPQSANRHLGIDYDPQATY